MWHPLDIFTPSTLGWLLVFLGIASVVIYMRLGSLGRRLRTSSAPLGIVSLEMSLSSNESRRIIDSWDKHARTDARQHLCLDYWFIPIYTTALAIVGLFSARWFADRGMENLSWLAMLLAWGQWLAGMFDFAQNSTMLRMLQMHPDIPDRLTRLAGLCARLKFLLIVAAAVCCFFGLVTRLT
jgi:hypothetical protein